MHEESDSAITKFLKDMDPHIDPKLMANLWDKYVTRSQANESLKPMVKMLRNGGFSSSNRFISPFYHN